MKKKKEKPPKSLKECGPEVNMVAEFMKVGRNKPEIRFDVMTAYPNIDFEKDAWIPALKLMRSYKDWDKAHLRKLHLSRYDRIFNKAYNVLEALDDKETFGEHDLYNFINAVDISLKAMWHTENIYGFHKAKGIKVINNEIVISDVNNIYSFVPQYAKALKVLNIDERKELKGLLLLARKPLDGVWPVNFKTKYLSEFVEAEVVQKKDLSLEKAGIKVETSPKPIDPADSVKPDLLFELAKKIKEADKKKILAILNKKDDAKQDGPNT